MAIASSARRSCTRATRPRRWRRFSEWAGRDRGGAPLIEFYHVPADGPFHQHVVALSERLWRLHHVPETFNRALFRKRSNKRRFSCGALPGLPQGDAAAAPTRLSETAGSSFAPSPGIASSMSGSSSSLISRRAAGRDGRVPARLSRCTRTKHGLTAKCGVPRCGATTARWRDCIWTDGRSRSP